MKKILTILAIFFLGYMMFSNTKAEILEIPNQAIRMRVIPNSNSIYDQEIKLKVRNKLESITAKLLENAESIEEARIIIKENLNNIDLEIKKLLESLNYKESHEINYGQNYFPEKEYKGVKYNEGYYESVVVTLGKGNGDNWWCVLFPPLCLLEAEESEDVEYQFYIKEVIEKFIK